MPITIAFLPILRDIPRGDVDGLDDSSIDGDVDGLDDSSIDGDVDGLDDSSIDGDVDGLDDSSIDGDVDGLDDSSIDDGTDCLGEGTGFIIGWACFHSLAKSSTQSMYLREADKKSFLNLSASGASPVLSASRIPFLWLPTFIRMSSKFSSFYHYQ